MGAERSCWNCSHRAVCFAWRQTRDLLIKEAPFNLTETGTATPKGIKEVIETVPSLFAAACMKYERDLKVNE